MNEGTDVFIVHVGRSDDSFIASTLTSIKIII